MDDANSLIWNRVLSKSAITAAILVFSSQLSSAIRRDVRVARSQDTSLSFGAKYDEQFYCLVYLAAVAQLPIDGAARQSLKTLVRNSGELEWLDSLAPRVALELVTGRNGTGIGDLYANLNHHNSGIRDFVLNLAWLARRRLMPIRATERVLFNVGGNHLYADKGLAVLRGMCRDDHEFWQYLGDLRPDFSRSLSYGWSLDYENPERSNAFVKEKLEILRDPMSELARYVREPIDLLQLEEDTLATSIAAANEFATQQEFWPHS